MSIRIDTCADFMRPAVAAAVGETGKSVCGTGLQSYASGAQRSYDVIASDPPQAESVAISDDLPEIVDPVVRELRHRLENHRCRNARRAGWTRRYTPTGLAPLDRALPHGGIPNGAVVEILADTEGIGATSLAMRLAAACSPSRAVVILDTRGDLYPPAAQTWGLPLTQLIVVRTSRDAEALWAVDQALRCRAVAAVIAPIVRIDERISRRLQLAAESSGAIGLVLAPARHRRKSFAALRMLVEGATADAAPKVPQHCHSPPLIAPYTCRLTLLKVREGTPAGPMLLDLRHETGDGPLHPVPLHRPAAKRA
jgi:protein ImuA